MIKSDPSWVLIIYAIDSGNKDYQEQINILEAGLQCLQSRNISWEQYLLNSRTALCFHKQHVNDDFTIVLNDHNGEEKFRSTTAILAGKIYEIVDGMLMTR